MQQTQKKCDPCRKPWPLDMSVAAHGLLDIDLCSYDQPEVYGVVTLQLEAANTLVGSVLRLGQSDQYRFPTSLRQ